MGQNKKGVPEKNMFLNAVEKKKKKSAGRTGKSARGLHR